jgi:mRNA-binding protein PUF3
MKPQLNQLKKYTSGKQIAALEKLIYIPPRQPYLPASISPTTQPMPIDINSTAATPMLTNGQNSPQSTNLSTNVSTVDDSTEGTAPPVKLDDPIKLDGVASPEVVINGL